jgi:hypothetical protein
MNHDTPHHDARRQRHLQLLGLALADNHGPRDWRDWKKGAARDLFELAERTPRISIHALRLQGDLHVVYEIGMPAPRWPRNDELVLARRAVFELRYQDNWRWESPPSYLPLSILDPPDVFHPNVRPLVLPDQLSGAALLPLPRAVLCLGHIPPGTLPKEIVLLGYFALSLQDCPLDDGSVQGVMNPLACDFFRHRKQHLPLTRAGLLDPWPSEQGATPCPP